MATPSLSGRIRRSRVGAPLAPAVRRGERTVRQLQDERDRQLATGRLRRAAEMTAWIDELMAENQHGRSA